MPLESIDLKIQQEIVNEGKNLNETDAGVALNEEIAAMKKEFQREKEELKKDLEQALQDKDTMWQEMLEKQQEMLNENESKLADARNKLEQDHNSNIRAMQDQIRDAKARNEELEAIIDQQNSSWCLIQ